MNYSLMPKIAIISLVNEIDDGLRESAKIIGRQIARNNGVVVTRGCPGLEHWVALGAKEEGGLSIGFSQASNKREHLEYKYPISPYVMFFTGPERSVQRDIMANSANAGIYFVGKSLFTNDDVLGFNSNKLCGFDVTAFLITQESNTDIIRALEIQHRITIIENDPVRLVQLIFKDL